MLCLCAACVSTKSPSYFEAAIQHHDAGRQTEARRDLRMELEKRPENLEARYDLAVLLENITKDEEARQLYEENMRRSMHLPTIVNLSALYRRQSNRSMATKLLQQAAKHFTAEAVPFYLLADVAMEDGDGDQAEKMFKRAIDADPANGFARIRYASFLFERGRMDEAQKHARRAVDILPFCASCWRTLGDVFLAAENGKQALEAFQRSAAIEPGKHIRQRIEQARQAVAGQP
ncbi:MAG: tetratricopeptide repeat protein [Mariprofundaceae bacterium]